MVYSFFFRYYGFWYHGCPSRNQCTGLTVVRFLISNFHYAYMHNSKDLSDSHHNGGFITRIPYFFSKWSQVSWTILMPISLINSFEFSIVTAVRSVTTFLWPSMSPHQGTYISKPPTDSLSALETTVILGQSCIYRQFLFTHCFSYIPYFVFLKLLRALHVNVDIKQQQLFCCS